MTFSEWTGIPEGASDPEKPSVFMTYGTAIRRAGINRIAINRATINRSAFIRSPLRGLISTRGFLPRRGIVYWRGDSSPRGRVRYRFLGL
jgi:hypothetical protein